MQKQVSLPHPLLIIEYLHTCPPSNTHAIIDIDVFLFYSQTFSESEVAIGSVDKILDQFFEGGGWAQCFDNIYAIEANIPAELDNYIPPAQEELYNWVNGPNRQFEAGKILHYLFQKMCSF